MNGAVVLDIVAKRARRPAARKAFGDRLRVAGREQICVAKFPPAAMTA